MVLLKGTHIFPFMDEKYYSEFEPKRTRKGEENNTYIIRYILENSAISSYSISMNMVYKKINETIVSFHFATNCPRKKYVADEYKVRGAIHILRDCY